MKEFLDKAAKAYYEGNPIISDDEFDALAAAHSYESVGTSDGAEVTHTYPMYSLQKVFEGETWPDVFKTSTVVQTVKLDGAAVALTYSDGKFLMGLTRGDGKKGRVITRLLKHLVPARIERKGLIQITGEVVASKEISNARNYASGALNLKDEEEFLTRDLTFIAYDVWPKQTSFWSEDLKSLSEFFTVLDSDWSQFPDDGFVLRIDSNVEFGRLGHTAHHPRGAFALKRKPQGVVTKLLNVKWDVGKSGVVTPVAILEPVKIGDATISRATLHNLKFIRDMNLEIGCNVEIVRSGEIIPKIVRRVF